MITNSEYSKLFNLDSEMTEEEITDHRDTYFGELDPRLGSSYIFDMYDPNGNDFITISPKHYFNTQGVISDQHNLCPIIPTDESDESNVTFFEECESQWVWTYKNKKITEKMVKKFFLNLGMTYVDITESFPEDNISTKSLKYKIDCWTTNLTNLPELYDLEWKRTSKKKITDFVNPIKAIVSKNFKTTDKISTVREFKPAKSSDYLLTIVSDSNDEHVTDWFLEKI